MHRNWLRTWTTDVRPQYARWIRRGPMMMTMPDGRVFSTLDRRYRRYFAYRPPVSFAVTTPDGQARTFGPDQPAFTITVNDNDGADALSSMDQLQVALAYLHGHLNLEGDVLSALTM